MRSTLRKSSTDKSERAEGKSKKTKKKRDGSVWNVNIHLDKNLVFSLQDDAREILALVDAAWANMLSGDRWFSDFSKLYKVKYGYEIETVPQRECFRFGPGRRTQSQKAAIIPVWA